MTCLMQIDTTLNNYSQRIKNNSIKKANHLKLPPLELLESVHEFPCVYSFKIIATNDEALLKNIVLAIQTILKLENTPQYSTRISKSGKHASLTLDIMLQKAQEVHLVYEELLKIPGILMLL